MYHLIVSTNQKTKQNIGENNAENSDCKKLLGIKMGNKLTFDCHVSNMCKIKHRKINEKIEKD